MKKSDEIVLFCDEERFREFLEPYVKSCAGDSHLKFVIEKQRDRATIDRHYESARMIWFDGFDHHVVEASQRAKYDGAKVICRLRGAKVLDTKIDDCRWEFIDHLVVTNPVSSAVLLDRIDRIESYCVLHQLSPAVDLADAQLSGKRRTKNLAYVGPLSSTRNAELLLQGLAALQRRDKDWKLYIIGDFENVSLQIHFEHLIAELGLAECIEFNSSSVNMTEWYYDKSFFILPGNSSGMELEAIRAMSFGLKPLVHNYYGSAQMFDECRLFGSVDQLCNLAEENAWSPEEYRSQVAERYNVRMLRQRFVDLFTPSKIAKTAPKVSILIPTYNRARMLEKLLGDLAYQTYSNREIVVIDDCSTDDTRQTVQRLLKGRSDIVYYRNDVNQGNAATMAIAASKATGDYVINCSDDDQLDAEALSKFVACAQSKDVDLIYCDLAVINGNGDQQGIWKYRNYYRNFDLLHELIAVGWNLIPETFFIKRELYNDVYTETYTKRFLNTYYLTRLRQLKMIHLPEPLYKYAVHTGSTFSTAVGLLDRCKSTQNFVNAALFMYSPLGIFSVSEGRSPAEQIAQAYFIAASLLVEHGNKCIKGEIYTGAKYERKDHLFRIYFYNAYHWLCLARKYGLDEKKYDSLLKAIEETADPKEFDFVKHAHLPAVYNRLPWFANKAFNNLSQFVALDIATAGAPPWLSDSAYTVYHEGKAHIKVCNHQFRDMEELDRIMSSNVITVINLFDSQSIEPVFRYLIERHLFSVHLINFTPVNIPTTELVKNIYNVNRQGCGDFDQYLDLATVLTTTRDYARTNLQTVS